MVETIATPNVIALNVSLFEGASLAESLPRIAELGFSAVELVADVPHLFPGTTAMGQVTRAAALLDSLGLQVANLNAETGRGFFSPIPPGPVYEPSLITPHGGSRRSRLTHVRRSLDFAYSLGAHRITVCSGAVLPGMTPPRAWEHLQEGLAVVLAHAEELGLLVAVAPRPGQLIGRTEDFLMLAEALPHPLLGISLDLAQLAKEGEQVAAAALACTGRLWSVQATDARLPSGYRVCPGQGDVGVEAAIAALRRIGYAGPYLLELENERLAPEHACENALHTMRNWLGEAQLCP